MRFTVSRFSSLSRHVETGGLALLCLEECAGIKNGRFGGGACLDCMCGKGKGVVREERGERSCLFVCCLVPGARRTGGGLGIAAYLGSGAAGIEDGDVDGDGDVDVRVSGKEGPRMLCLEPSSFLSWCCGVLRPGWMGR